MNLSKTVWNPISANAFMEYLASFGQPEKEAWARKILNTNLKLLVIPTRKINEMVREIYLGDYRAFLNLKLFHTYESIAIFGLLVTKIKDFEEMKTYLNQYLDVMENWAHCDLLTFEIHPSNINGFIQLSETYLTSSKVFVRRLGLLIIFHLIKDPIYLDYAFQVLEKLRHEEAYYVIMMAGWLLSECIIRYYEPSLKRLSQSDMNPNIVNKGIQKCRDSRRLSLEMKDELLKYKIKRKFEPKT